MVNVLLIMAKNFAQKLKDKKKLRSFNFDAIFPDGRMVMKLLLVSSSRIFTLLSGSIEDPPDAGGLRLRRLRLAGKHHLFSLQSLYINLKETHIIYATQTNIRQQMEEKKRKKKSHEDILFVVSK